MKDYIEAIEKADAYDDALFATLVSRGLELLGLSARDVAHQFGASIPTVTRWTRGITVPHPAMRPSILGWFKDRAIQALPEPVTPWSDAQLDSFRRRNEGDIVGVGEDEQRRDRKWLATVDAARDDAQKSLEAYGDNIRWLAAQHTRLTKVTAAHEALRKSVIAYIEQHSLEHDWQGEEEGSDACPEDDTCRCPLIQAIEAALKPVVD